MIQSLPAAFAPVPPFLAVSAAVLIIPIGWAELHEPIPVQLADGTWQVTYPITIACPFIRGCEALGDSCVAELEAMKERWEGGR